jgi:hypothetical protein
MEFDTVDTRDVAWHGLLSGLAASSHLPHHLCNPARQRSRPRLDCSNSKKGHMFNQLIETLGPKGATGAPTKGRWRPAESRKPTVSISLQFSAAPQHKMCGGLPTTSHQQECVPHKWSSLAYYVSTNCLAEIRNPVQLFHAPRRVAASQHCVAR